MKSKLKNKLFIILLVLSICGISQNETQKWHFGNNIGLDFSTSPPTTFSGSAISTTAGCSSICNGSGSTLFYTDGVTVWNQTNSIMNNGTGLFGTSGAQNSIIVKQPSNANLYYIFTVASGGSTIGLNYSIVDMNLSAGMGSVTVKNASLFSGACEEKISAVKHCNQNDVWIMTHQMDTNLFRAHLLTSLGVNTVAIVSASGSVQTGPSAKGGLKFSPNGRRGAMVYTKSNSSGGVTFTNFSSFNFDNSTGIVSNNVSIANYLCYSLGNCWAYGVEFSPDGSKIYSTYHGYVFQNDNCNPPVSLYGSLGHEENNYTTYNRASMQLGPDGKIYIANGNTSALDVIHNPNLTGAACGYSVNNLAVGTNACKFGLPSFVTSYFEKTPTNFTIVPLGYPTCLTESFVTPTICAFTGYTVSTYNWNFGDPSSGSANTSTLAYPTHAYSAQGTYTVTLIVNYVCGRSDTISKPLTVYSNPVISILSPSINCGSVSSTISVSGGIGPFSYTWIPSNQSSSVANNLNPGVYSVIVQDNGGGCSGVFSTTINPTIINGTVLTSPICPGVNSGTASIIVSGGSGAYNYSWSGSTLTSSLVTGLPTGNNSITFTDPTYSCALTKNFNITQLPTFSISFASSSYSACIGNSLTLNSNVVGASPNYTYSWIGGPSTSTYSIVGSNAGTQVYSLQVLDSHQCSLTNTVTVNFVSNPILSVSGNTACMNSPAIMIASGATTFTWYPTISYSSSYTINNPTATAIYSVKGKMSTCESLTTVTLTVYPKPLVSLSSNSPLCTGQTLGLSSTLASSYQWIGPSSFTSTNQNPLITNINASNAGVYNLTLTSVNSCTNSASLNVIINPAPTISLNSIKTICPWQPLTLNAYGALTYTWNTGAHSSSISITPSVSSTYIVNGTNSFSCVSSSSVFVQVKECLGLSELIQDIPFTLYPIPNFGILNIETESKLHFSVYDFSGKLVFQSSCEKGKSSFDISFLSNGIFMIVCKVEENLFVTRLIKT